MNLFYTYKAAYINSFVETDIPSVDIPFAPMSGMQDHISLGGVNPECPLRKPYSRRLGEKTRTGRY